MKFKVILFFIIAPYLLLSQIKEFEFDKSINYKIIEINTGDIVGSATQYFNTKKTNYSLIYFLQYKGIFEAPNEVYNKEIILLENQDKYVYLTNKDIFANKFIINVQKDGFEKNLYPETPVIENFEKKREIGTYTCDMFTLKSPNEPETFFCLDSRSKIDNLGVLVPKEVRGKLKGLVVEMVHEGKQYKLTEVRKLNEKFTVNYSSANKVYSVLKKTTIPMAETIDKIEEKIDEIPDESEIIARNIGLLANLGVSSKDIDVDKAIAATGETDNSNVSNTQSTVTTTSATNQTSSSGTVVTSNDAVTSYNNQSTTNSSVSSTSSPNIIISPPVQKCIFNGTPIIEHAMLNNSFQLLIKQLCEDESYFLDSVGSLKYKEYNQYIDKALDQFEKDLYKNGRYNPESIKKYILEMRNFISRRKIKEY